MLLRVRVRIRVREDLKAFRSLEDATRVRGRVRVRVSERDEVSVDENRN